MVQENDEYVGRSLVQYGEYSEGEWTLLRQLLRPGDTVIEAGANIGAHTVPIARQVGADGRILAFEPQRLVHQMLCGNLALNEIENTAAIALALGDRAGQVHMPLIHYGAQANFGGVELANAGEPVAMSTVDAVRLERLDLFKADVEGAEELVLRGAEATLKRLRPWLYVENDRRERSPALLGYLISLGYDAWWHLPPLFNPGNFLGNATNVFGNIRSVNILCRHTDNRAKPLPVEIELVKVESVTDWLLP